VSEPLSTFNTVLFDLILFRLETSKHTSFCFVLAFFVIFFLFSSSVR